MTRMADRPKPFVVPEYCKGCGRCVSSCTKGCITMGTEINPVTGLVPIILDLSQCNGCGLCYDACPEPYGLRPQGDEVVFELIDPATVLGPRPFEMPEPERRPDTTIPLPEREPLVVKGTYAAAVGAVLAGCRTGATAGSGLSYCAGRHPEKERGNRADVLLDRWTLAASSISGSERRNVAGEGEGLPGRPGEHGRRHDAAVGSRGILEATDGHERGPAAAAATRRCLPCRRAQRRSFSNRRTERPRTRRKR